MWIGTARDGMALLLLLGSTAIALVGAPGTAWSEPHEPTTRAGFFMVVMLVVQLALRRSGRWVRMERLSLCAFLAVMPLVYLESGLWHDAGEKLLLELLGALVFVPWAALAYNRDAAVLAAGLVAHGVLWDSWHHDAAYIAEWYATACLVVDVGWAGYVVLQRERWAAADGEVLAPAAAR